MSTFNSSICFLCPLPLLKVPSLPQFFYVDMGLRGGRHGMKDRKSGAVSRMKDKGSHSPGSFHTLRPRLLHTSPRLRAGLCARTAPYAPLRRARRHARTALACAVSWRRGFRHQPRGGGVDRFLYRQTMATAGATARAAGCEAALASRWRR